MLVDLMIGVTTSWISVDMNLPAGWSMISLPINPTDKRLKTLFPGAIVVYSYEKGTGYVRVGNDQDLEVGKGCWISLNEETSYTLTGDLIQSYTHPAASIRNDRFYHKIRPHIPPWRDYRRRSPTPGRDRGWMPAENAVLGKKMPFLDGLQIETQAENMSFIITNTNT